MPQFTVFKGSAEGIIQESKTTRSVGPNDVVVKVTHSGVCASDENYRRQDMVLGHEGAGVISAIGEKVTKYHVGQRCGWGYQHSSCGSCKQCLSGSEAFCPKKGCFAYANRDQGSFGTEAVWSEDWVYLLPDELASEDAAPLMCAGSTVWSALSLYPVKATDRVGIIGLGGLGHLAVQFAVALGCEVVVFSTTEGKKTDALQLGATSFFATAGLSTIDIGKPLDRLLATGSQQPDWKLFFPLMAPRSSIYPLTIAFDQLSVPYLQFVLAGIRLQGATISSRQAHADMLKFAAQHGVKPWKQYFPLSREGVTKAMNALKGGTVRYRAVLVA